jgi:hypothetical protein
MAVAANLRSKRLYKLTIWILKIIPMVIALCDVLNTGFWLFGVDAWFLSYIGGISFLTLAFLYLASYVFCFCEYHRMFLHYVLVNNIISVVDYYSQVEVSAIVYLITIGIFLFIILYLYKKGK